MSQSGRNGQLPSSVVSAELIERAEKILGHRFENRHLLELALTHSSLSDSRLASNERLEFLGDAVLGCVVCERIYECFPEHLEGEMTKIKSSAVSRRTCADLAVDLEMSSLIQVGKGMRTGKALPRSLSAAVVESLLGALYMDAGLEAVKRFILPHLDPVLHDADASGHQRNFKSVLQQHAQATRDSSPQYSVLNEKGPDHAKSFQIAVEIDGEQYEPAWGNSKKQAEQQAALNALRTLELVRPTEDGSFRLVELDGVDGA